MTDLAALTDLDAPIIEALAERAIALEAAWRARDVPQTLVGARIGSIAELPGWRNPTALALGMAAMGGACVTVTARLEGAESVEDLAGYMDNWFDLLAVRTPDLARLRRFADALRAPVMNLRTNANHPCEVLGDLAFALRERGSWDGLRVAMVGPAGNIARSWAEAASVLPIEVVHVRPPTHAFGPDDPGGAIEGTDDIGAIESANLIVTDCWPPGASATDAPAFARHRITADRLARCRPDVLFVPCPPVTRGEEVSDDAIEHPRCLATPAKAFLMHAQNAFVERALARTPER